MRQYELVERVTRYNPAADEGLLNKAYVYAMQKHGAQLRANGDPYFSHPLEVAAILTDLKLDDATIAVALLHDTIEDTDATRSEIDAMFGEDIGRLVEGLTKIKKLDLVSKKAAQAENLRKLLLAISADIRVLLVKLADRLHNMRTLHFMPPDKRGRIAEETLEIYAPLAGRMGMQDMREELEEIAFKVVNPEAHETIVGRLAELAQRHKDLITDIETDLGRRFADRGLGARVIGRRKRPYSIFRKMERKAVSFEQLSDIFGFRVVVGSLEECYGALGVIHTTWPTVPGRFKDYISTPKQNDYRSIHTTVIGPQHQRVELQIRTEAMHRVAEFGIAAHALYKDGVAPPKGMPIERPPGANLTGFSAEVKAYEWLRRTIQMLADGDTPEEFLEHTKLELFQDQVFCFTPKGRLIALPRGATPIDFAYAVHTNVGDTAVGVRINGRTMALSTELQNGDEVEIIRAEGHVPQAAWENLVRTGKARSSIRRATRVAVRKQYAGLGRLLVERAFRKAELPLDDALLKAALPRLAQSDLDDMLAAVGRGEIPPGNVVKAVHPEYKDASPSNASPSPSATAQARRSRAKKANAGIAPVPIRGIEGNLAVRYAPDGGAVPGDRIIGIITPGEGVTIYPIQSPSLKDFDEFPDRWLDVRWEVDQDSDLRFPARISITVLNEPGTLAQVTQIIAAADANISNLRIRQMPEDFSELVIDLEVANLKHLTRVIAGIRALPAVSSASRVYG
ncbi:MAG: bifunctional (p)ppGpp synthetase/guanosine-3',5'-bis(diphosphate) 3'-pyrophosphohydrolase [Bauldia sp.]|nr:bifunctional (p)ppGpp synthetase/guanosine-3',5'-bis(diphosphate) 3'-pyrophosphohydrolase [Bauldia sp.]